MLSYVRYEYFTTADCSWSLADVKNRPLSVFGGEGQNYREGSCGVGGVPNGPDSCPKDLKGSAGNLSALGPFG